MGANDRKNDAKDEANRKRRERREARTAAAQRVQVTDIPMEAFMWAMQRILAAGGALRVGVTRDGGAWAFGVYGLGEPYTEYVRPGESLTDYFEGLGTAFEEML